MEYLPKDTKNKLFTAALIHLGQFPAGLRLHVQVNQD